MNEISTPLYVVFKTLYVKKHLPKYDRLYVYHRIIVVVSLTSLGCLVRLIYNASRGCIVPGCARRDGVEACGRISLEGDENGIGGWRKQRDREKERKGKRKREKESKKDRRPAKQREKGRDRRERGKSFHRDRNEKGSGRCSIVFSPSDPERTSLRRKHARAGSQTHFYDFNIADICAVYATAHIRVIDDVHERIFFLLLM